MMPSNTELESASSVARENLAQLSTWFLNFRSALIALSSGVDSSVLACIARRSLGKMNSLAVTSISEAFSTAELDEAKRIAKEIDIELETVYQTDLSTEGYVANAVNRCYFCRSNLVAEITRVAKRRKIDICVDGTHLDDLKNPRPGIKALREGGFRAPFVEIGLAKQDIKEIARILKLSNSEKPSESCLSSRIAYDQRIDGNTLRLIERAEQLVREITRAKIIRVRTESQSATVEVDIDSLQIALKNERQIETALKDIGYSSVAIDPRGYTSGKMLSLYVETKAD
jgi:uncharacterized protein